MASQWRVYKAEDLPGWYMYFDASREVPGVRDLTKAEKKAIVDTPISVSGSVSDEDTVRETKTISGRQDFQGLDGLPF